MKINKKILETNDFIQFFFSLIIMKPKTILKIQENKIFQGYFSNNTDD